MQNPELEQYIKDSLSKGIPREEISKVLLSEGWGEKDIEDVLNKLNPEKQPSEKESVSSSKSASKFPRKNIARFVVVVLFLVTGISAAGFFAYKSYFQEQQSTPKASEEETTPEAPLQKLLPKPQTQIKTLYADAKINLAINYLDDDSEPIEPGQILDLKFSHYIDRSNSEIPKSFGQFENTLGALSIAGESKSVGATDYFNFSSFSSPAPLLDYTGPSLPKDLSEVPGQWVRIDKHIWRHLVTNNLFWGPGLIVKGYPEMVSLLEELFAETSTKEQLADEILEGQETRHYLVVLDRENTQKLFYELLKVIDPERSRRKEIKFLESEENDKFFDSIGEITAEIWVGKNDNFLYKGKISKKVDITEVAGSGGIDVSMAKNILLTSLEVEVNFSRFNEPVNIYPADDFIALEEIIGIWMSMSAKRDSIRDDDLSEIAGALYLYYDEFQEYPQSNAMPTSINGYLTRVPVDSGDGPCPGSYRWISNIGSPQQFCMWACQENGRFYAAFDHPEFNTGGHRLDNAPTDLSCGFEVDI